MIPSAQFDPSTLAIWTTTGPLLEPEAGAAAAAMRAAARGADPSGAVGGLPPGDPRRTRLVWLISSVWHEKRHYLDVCLTNYGARRFRNLFNLAANVDPLVAEAKKLGAPVWFPVEVYGCKTLRRVLGIPEPAPNILESARLARLMKSFTTQLDAPWVLGESRLYLGGEAQLEGLAQVSQVHSIEFTFGTDDVLAVTADWVHPLPREGPYRTIEAVAGVLGCARDIGGVTVINPNLAAALFVTALCGRYFGAGPQPPAELTAPGPRLARMIEELGPQPGRFDTSDAEAAEVVDRVAKRLWGRTAFEEIAADIDAMDGKVDRASAPWLAENGMCDAYADFVALRRRLLAAVGEGGLAGVLPRAFAPTWRDQLVPWHVVATPEGSADDGSAPVVFGCRLNVPPELAPVLPPVVVWGRLHAAAPGEAAARFAPRDRSAWLQMLEHHGPRAHLMLNGRLHRRMVPPELDRPVAEIEQLGVPVRFHPRFEWPEQRDQKTRTSEAVALARFAGRRSFVCDITGDEIEPNSAAVLTPWEFRRSALLPRFLQGGLMNEITLGLNWSDWVVRSDLLD
jgi:hypothetical protein